jgi:hypothetical protein
VCAAQPFSTLASWISSLLIGLKASYKVSMNREREKQNKLVHTKSKAYRNFYYLDINETISPITPTLSSDIENICKAYF